ncbi:hypothetical protein PR048_006981 [Dryococelus australis]|uniref:Uncharacterized protein n=1 Tax=Dryococelus australis TaxID=614101 RepID=A0ABQ9ID00_9NEOP|nr:hypothetical protein PR048_006981 [Dryococelus australis]
MAIRRQENLEAAWTDRGKIFVKKTAESKPIQVKDSWSLDDACNARNDFSEHTELKNVFDSATKISLLHLDIRSLRNKIEDLNNETTYYNLPGYTSYFSCRDLGNGGGVAIYVQNCFTQSLLSCNNNGYYSLWVEISNIGTFKKLYLGGYYRLPQYKLQNFLFALDHDLVNCKKVDTFILGDFNINMCEQNNEFTVYKVIYRSYFKYPPY